MSAPTPRLQLCNLHRSYGGEAVVRDVSLEVVPGQVTCLLGPSGCGKSTTLRLAAGVERQEAGSVYVDGRLLSGDDVHTPPERRNIGMMFQDFALFPHLDVADNVAFGLKGSKRHNRAQVRELLQKVGMLRHIDAYPHQLSGGEQQRVALARALAPQPSVMLMDEPFSGLDDRLRDDIRDETLDLLKSEGTAVLLVTHEPSEAMRMADEIALMRAGEIVQRGAPYNVYNSPVDKEAAAFFSDINVLHGVVSDQLTRTAFGPFLTPGIPDGTSVDIVFRPQHVRIDFDRAGRGPGPTDDTGMPARAIVKRSRFMGYDSLIEFTLEEGGMEVSARVPNVFLPKTGTALWLMVRRDRCFVFPVCA